MVAALGAPGHAPVTFPGGVVSVSPGATVLLKTEAGTPALAVHPRGRGQVLAWLGADWWRWYLAESGAAEPPNPWPGVLRWLLSPDAGRRLRLHFSKETYASGEPIPVGVEVFGPGWEPAQEGWAELEVRGVGEAVAFRRRVALASGERLPEVEIPGLAGGAWEIKARAELPGGDRLTADSRILVSPALPEHALLHPDHRSLARLADRTGGIMVGLDGGDRLDSLLSAGDGIRVRPLPVRRNPLTFLLLVTLLGAEWWLRNRRGLP